jgi:hypothetical protein
MDKFSRVALALKIVLVKLIVKRTGFSTSLSVKVVHDRLLLKLLSGRVLLN